MHMMNFICNFWKEFAYKYSKKYYVQIVKGHNFSELSYVCMSISVCVCLSMCSCMCVCRGACMCIWTCVCSRSEVRLWYRSSGNSLLTFVFLRQGVSLAWNSLKQTGLTGQGSFPSAGIRSVCHHPWLYNVSSGAQTQILVLTRQTLYQLCRFCNPVQWTLKKALSTGRDCL